MRRRLFAACAVLVVLASVIPLSASRSCCCRKSACAMHQKHDDGGCRLDRCRDREDATVQAPAVRAILVSVTLTHPTEQCATFAATASHAAETRAVTPLHPPPRVV